MQNIQTNNLTRVKKLERQLVAAIILLFVLIIGFLAMYDLKSGQEALALSGTYSDRTRLEAKDWEKLPADFVNAEGDTITGDLNLNTVLNHAVDSPFYINSNDELQLRINSDGSGTGNFGINNSSNDRIFTVTNNGYALASGGFNIGSTANSLLPHDTNNIRMDAAKSIYMIFDKDGTGTGDFYVAKDGPGGEVFTIKNNGNVCIGDDCRTGWPVLQCPPKRVMVDEESSDWNEWAQYGTCAPASDYIEFFGTQICDNGICLYLHNYENASCEQYCREFGFSTGVVSHEGTGGNRYYYQNGKWKILSTSSSGLADRCKCSN